MIYRKVDARLNLAYIYKENQILRDMKKKIKFFIIEFFIIEFLNSYIILLRREKRILKLQINYKDQWYIRKSMQ